MNGLLIKLRNTKTTVVAGLLSFALFAVSQMISSAVETSKQITLIRVMIITLSVVLYLGCYYSSDSCEDHKRQITWINVVVMVFHIIYCLVALRTIIYIRYLSQMYMEALWILAATVVVWDGRSVIGSSLRTFRKKDNRSYAMMAGAFAIILIVMSYDVDGPHFVWDARSMYARLNMLHTTDLFDISKFFVFFHVDVAYFYSVFLIDRVVGDLDMGYWIYNAVCIIAISYGVVFLLKKTLPQKDVWFITAASAGCLFSPYICGLSTHYTYDYALSCFVPLLILFAVNRDWVYFLFLGIYISLIKETGIIAVASVCAGIILMEVMSGKKIKDILIRKRTLCEVYIAVLFLVCYKTYSKWETEYRVGSFGYESEHFQRILKMFLILNYEWMIVLLSILLLFVVIIKKKRINAVLAVYSVSAIFPLVFYLFYVTNEYPRYIGYFQVLLLLIVISLMAGIDLNPCFERGLLCALSILMLTTSFFSFDPVSFGLFNSADVGDASLYFSKQDFDFGGDPCIYNRQYYGMDIVFDRALKRAVESGDSLIAVSNGNNHRTWAMDGGLYAYEDTGDKRIFDEFWDIKKDSRSPVYDYEYYSDPNYIHMGIRYIFPDDDIIAALDENDSFIYIYIPTQNGGKESIVRDSFEVLEEGSFSSHGWVLAYIRGKDI